MSFDEFNKIAAGVLTMFLVFLLLNFFSHQIYGGGGHSGDEQLAFAIEIETDDEEEEVVEIDLAALAASADPAAGQKVFNKCKACHKVEDGANGVGPHLWGVINRDIASVEGYSYSGVLNEAPGDWTLEELSAFLENPKAYANGTKMAFAGLKDAEDRVNLIVWLNEADGSPEPLE